MTPPVKDKAKPLTAPYRKDFSLTSGAKFLEIGKGTLRSAIERGEVKATKNAAGHYIIEGAQIFQYETNLKADQLQDVPARASTGGETRASTSGDTPSGTGAKGGASTGAKGGDGTGADTPSDRRAGTVSADLHKTLVDSLEARLRDKDGTIKRLENDVEKWQTQSNSWQKHADNNLRLLEDNREKLAEQALDIDLTPAEEGGNFWRNIAALFVVVALTSAALYYKDDIANTVTNFTAGSGSNAAAIESEIPRG